MEVLDIDEISTALIKEYLSSKGLKNSLETLEKEKPRNTKSISRRSILVKILNIEKLYRRNKKQQKPYQSVIEVIVRNLVESNNAAVLNDLTKSTVESKSVVTRQMSPHLGSGSWSSEVDGSSGGSSVSSGLSGHSLKIPEGIPSVPEALDSGHSKPAKYDPINWPSDVYGERNKHFPLPKNEVSLSGQETDVKVQSSLENRLKYLQELRKEALGQSALSSNPATNKMTPSEDVSVVDLDEDDLAQGVLLTTPTAKPIFKLSGTRITGMRVKEIKSLMFGKSINFNEEWRMQNLNFSSAENLTFGLVQKKGGPCGVLACLQSYILRELIFPDKGISVGLNPNPKEQDQALISAITRVIWKAGQLERAIVAVPKRQNKDSLGKSDDVTESLMLYEMLSLADTQECVAHHLKVFKEDGNFGCIAFLYSAVLSRGIEKIRSDMDESEGKLIGAHGYCTQEMVNLLLTGKAVSNVFDGILELDSGGKEKSILRGVEEQSEIGFLSLFEHYDSCKVGNNLKSSKLPIWVVCSESHFTVLFSTNVRVASAQYEFNHFTLYYYDGFGQDCEIRLLVDTNVNKQKHFSNRFDDYRTPPLEHCIHTKWPACGIRWEGCEPLL